ncbi:ATP-dependent RNA helicase prh1 [Cryptococcus neoformans C23]|uniref:RNA helicase n=2 Tax=Cryptococcus neoformans TaxID=5207 RepID=A0A854QLX5_CRYNE|nr:ATP-dependent RNA helicase prh1 [Cryptococcus neoformans var. grubii H99]AUB22332.1 ATP-dependent RNA helicase prh1 [Cryptococcus neoformans var. grubii]OWZ36641.1 ATP-dependent RNA helicase prh1 [Cryptococcus neoformans var. grubii AD2-60a]OWZ48311.1 ATP-dependent RNA helicase prh1 [Cryptococcus neoformans var. grubii C23]OWZ56019.1 ATP-dependent RNA helicase prh1 [Cryptococcus neoformans var. grubii AD1-83a]OWZ58080.1 ATP-dependent RNA helicase prh1 [Cryptococcus neoformans var. grubii 12|eukprot:XP_012046409.1 ATP-dependent RNA helicase prh1 [Cryptococcus neoformans var. grubii H99]
MTIAASTSSQPSNSAKPQPRVSNFNDSSDEDETESTPKTEKKKKKKINNLDVNGLNSPKGPKKRKIGEANGDLGKGKKDGAEARRMEAERLLAKRKELPFYQGRRMILEEIMANDTTIILGETGCGKSTQLPQLLRTHPVSVNYFSPSSSNRFRGPSIAITQPRRLPAIALANRVSQEMGCQIGGEVGYSVRFEDVTSRETRVRYLTEGVLMRELAGSDPKISSTKKEANGTANGGGESDSDLSEGQGLNLLLDYDVVVIDEAHERTLNTDFLCGALKRVQRIRKDIVRRQTEEESQSKPKITGKKKVKELKLVIMSATLDPTKFKTFFGTGRDALLVKGRMYEVATQHVLEPVDDFIEAAARQVMTVHCSPDSPGDVLVFMPGSEEIENCVELLKRVSKQLAPGSSTLQVLPLYAALPPTAQSKIFIPTPPNTRRVIVATNIAETSMTIPGVAFVIDSGFKKEKEYVFRNAGALEHLRKKGISKASAWQRTGRAGRERAGHCYRLFTQDFFNKMPEFDAPEIQRCNLSSAVLQLIAMGQNPFEFEYIDNPGRDSILAAFQELVGLSALSSPTTITPLGLQMLRFPLDPPHARILLAAFEYGCANEIIDIISLVNAGGNVFIDRPNDREEAAQARQKFIHREGDHLTMMNVFRAYTELKESKSSSHSNSSSQSLVGWCKDNHVNSKTLAQALKVREQLRELSERLGKDWKASCGSEWGMVGRSLLQGLFMNTAVIQADGSYRQTAGSLTVKIHPSSVLMSKKVPAILYDELTITTAFYARNVSAFEQHWLTEVPWFAKAGTSVAAPVGKGNL